MRLVSTRGIMSRQPSNRAMERTPKAFGVAHLVFVRFMIAMSQTLPRIALLSAVLAATAVASLCAQKIVPSSGSNPVTDAIPMKMVLQQVPPEYPYEARRSGITGHGILFGRVDFKTGIVTSVKMEKSTGNTLLDQAALNPFRQWRFKPGTVRQFRTPINFTMPH